MKAPHKYAVQGSDTTMLTVAASLPGNKNDKKNIMYDPIKYKTPAGTKLIY